MLCGVTFMTSIVIDTPNNMTSQEHDIIPRCNNAYKCHFEVCLISALLLVNTSLSVVFNQYLAIKVIHVLISPNCYKLTTT